MIKKMTAISSTGLFLSASLFFFIGMNVPAQAIETAEKEAALVAIEHQLEAAYLAGDTAFLEATVGEDFLFTHASGNTENKSDTLAKFAKPGNFISRVLTSVDAEVHGNAALTSGRIEVVSSSSTEYTICYIRLYMQNENADWQLVSHRSYKAGSGHQLTCDAQ